MRPLAAINGTTTTIERTGIGVLCDSLQPPAVHGHAQRSCSDYTTGAKEALDKRGLSGGSKQERVPLTVNCF